MENLTAETAILITIIIIVAITGIQIWVSICIVEEGFKSMNTTIDPRCEDLKRQNAYADAERAISDADILKRLERTESRLDKRLERLERVISAQFERAETRADGRLRSLNSKLTNLKKV